MKTARQSHSYLCHLRHLWMPSHPIASNPKSNFLGGQNPKSQLCALCVLCGFILLTPACSTDPTKGYSSASIYHTDISTIAVPIFASDSFTRNVEFELTDALIKEIESRTPYKVTSAANADTIVLGRIRDVSLDQLSKSRLTGLSEEVIVSLTIDFQWKDQRNGSILVERRDFASHGLFVPSRPTGEPVELGTFAVVKQLAYDIVNQMQTQW